MGREGFEDRDKIQANLEKEGSKVSSIDDARRNIDDLLKKGSEKQNESLDKDQRKMYIDFLQSQLGPEFLEEMGKRVSTISYGEITQLIHELIQNEQAFKADQQYLFDLDEQEEEQLHELVLDQLADDDNYYEKKTDKDLEAFFQQQRQETVLLSDYFIQDGDKKEKASFTEKWLDKHQYTFEQNIQKQLQEELGEKADLVSPTVINNISAGLLSLGIHEITKYLNQNDTKMKDVSEMIDMLTKNFQGDGEEKADVFLFRESLIDGIVKHIENDANDVSEPSYFENSVLLMSPKVMREYFAKYKSSTDFSTELQTGLKPGSQEFTQTNEFKDLREDQQEVAKNFQKAWAEKGPSSVTTMDNIVDGMTSFSGMLTKGIEAFTSLMDQFPEIVLMREYLGKVMAGQGFGGLEDFSKKLEKAQKAKMKPSENKMEGYMNAGGFPTISMGNTFNPTVFTKKLLLDETRYKELTETETDEFLLTTKNVPQRLATNMLVLTGKTSAEDEAKYMPDGQPNLNTMSSLVGEMIAQYKQRWEDEGYVLTPEQFDDAIKLLLTTGKYGPVDYFLAGKDIQKNKVTPTEQETPKTSDAAVEEKDKSDWSDSLQDDLKEDGYEGVEITYDETKDVFTVNYEVAVTNLTSSEEDEENLKEDEMKLFTQEIATSEYDSQEALLALIKQHVDTWKSEEGVADQEEQNEEEEEEDKEEEQVE